MENRKLFNQLTRLNTEKLNKRSGNIDAMKTKNLLITINREDQKVIRAVRREIPRIARAVELIVESFNKKGRLIYVGAGTSGRLGVLDASECPPTFGVSPRMVQGIMAGGRRAVFQSLEGAEDSRPKGAADVRSRKVNGRDVVCGLAASTRTPYVLAAVKEAKKLGAKTVFITTNPKTSIIGSSNGDIMKYCDVMICPDVGPEIIMGSTRMKSGTAQKLVLNMLTTGAMIKIGKVYKNMMVDLKLKSEKLKERAKRIIMIITGVDYATASKALRDADNHVKTAIVMIRLDIAPGEARSRIKASGGFVRRALEVKEGPKRKSLSQR